MPHSFAKELQYLMALKDAILVYYGLLGPKQHHEKLFNELLEKHAGISELLLEVIYGPALKNRGAETPPNILP